MIFATRAAERLQKATNAPNLSVARAMLSTAIARLGIRQTFHHKRGEWMIAAADFDRILANLNK